MEAKLKIAGMWSGVVEVRLDEWTVLMVRQEVSRRSGGGNPPETIKLISAGKVLKDEADTTVQGCPATHQTLLQVGLKNNSKILASSIEPTAAMALVAEEKRLKEELVSEEERAQRLTRLRASVEQLAGRHVDGSLPMEGYNIELEDQNGQIVKVGSEHDQRGVMMGLMLHANAKRLIKKCNYKDSLDVLTMGEEAFSLCDPKIIEMVDNVPILQIDIVWCYFMLRDISWLSMAGLRLANARKGFERSHGKDASRIRLLQAGCHAELAVYLRLELLEGVVAYHTGQFQKSQKALSSAYAKYLQLQVPDEALSMLLSMGYKEQAAKRALRMNNQDVPSAVDFLVEERARKVRRRQENIQRQNEIKEQKLYGMTRQKKVINLQKLKDLVAIGFERFLAAEALRLNENDTQKALDDLTNPEINSKLQLHIERQRLLKESKRNQPNNDNLGYDRSSDGALDLLASTASQSLPNSTSPATSSNSENVMVASVGRNNKNALPNIDGENGTSVVEDKPDHRDVEMEDEITSELTGDPFADYDIEVTQEAEAIMEYLALLESATNQQSIS